MSVCFNNQLHHWVNLENHRHARLGIHCHNGCRFFSAARRSTGHYRI